MYPQMLEARYSGCVSEQQLPEVPENPLKRIV